MNTAAATNGADVDAHVVIGKRSEELVCVLTDAEVRERADLLATKRKRQREVERRKALAMAEFKASLAEIDEAIDTLADAIKSTKETRAVDCEERAFPELGKAVLVRLDSGAEVRSRALTARELEKFLGKKPEEVKPEPAPDGKSAGAGEKGEPGGDAKPEGKGKKKGKKKRELGPDERPDVGVTAKGAAAVATGAERCPAPSCTLPVEHDGPHIVADPSEPAGDESFE